MTSPWLEILATLAVASGVLSAGLIALDIVVGHRQQMGIMNLVWPITGLWAGPLSLWAYFRVGRLATRAAVRSAEQRGEEPPARKLPFAAHVGLAATHCGAGCSLGDLLAESFLMVVPLALFGRKIFAAWALDYLLAFGIGIVFQYFTIAPMRGLGLRKGIREALKADALSLTAWQVGMYGWMAIVVFAVFGRELPKTSALFWFMMQLAMACGFATAYPINWWLLRRGIKEEM